jgi:hypothetical protein
MLASIAGVARKLNPAKPGKGSSFHFTARLGIAAEVNAVNNVACVRSRA